MCDLSCDEIKKLLDEYHNNKHENNKPNVEHMEYIVEKINKDNYVQTKINNNNVKHIRDCFSNNTIYGKTNRIYNNLKSNTAFICLGDHDDHFPDIIWFDSILCDLNDINKLLQIQIEIGTEIVWDIDVKLLLKIIKPEIFDSKIKISIPKNLFMNDDNDLLNNLVGIQIISLQYHEVHFCVKTTSQIKYDLSIQSTYLNSKVRRVAAQLSHEISINKIEKLNDDVYNIVRINTDVLCKAINSGNTINYIKQWNDEVRNQYIINLSIFPNVLNNIINEYDKDKNYHYFNIAIDDENDKYNYCIQLNFMRLVSGMGGCINYEYKLKYPLSNYGYTSEGLRNYVSSL
jgi:hypothetical protein